MDLIPCDKTDKREDPDDCKGWFREEGICVDCSSFDKCKLNAEGKEKEDG